MTDIGWLAIAGPTASGKTALALAVAQQYPVEIISIDSALVYRQMDIGTAKPSAAERTAVPHHLIDIREPTQPYSAAECVRDVTPLIHAIRARGRLPLLVGGTMLYFKALFEGLDELPPAQPALRARIEEQALALGWPALHARLALVDPTTAQRLSPNDSQRIGRALEVFEATGTPLSSLHTRSSGTQTSDTPLQMDGLPGALWSLEPRDRAWLHARIDQRFGHMLASGFIDEVRALRARGDLTIDHPAIRCVGYRQAWSVLDAADDAGDGPLDAHWMTLLHTQGTAATRQLAKRQLTWLRSMPQRHAWPCDQIDTTEQALRCLRTARRV